MQQFNNENMKLKKYLYETAKYVLRSYPVIYPYIKEVEKLYAMSPEELNQRNEKRFLEIFHRAYDKSPFTVNYIRRQAYEKRTSLVLPISRSYLWLPKIW